MYDNNRGKVVVSLRYIGHQVCISTLGPTCIFTKNVYLNRYALFSLLAMVNIFKLFSHLVGVKFIKQRGRKLTPTTVYGCRYCVRRRDNWTVLGVA